MIIVVIMVMMIIMISNIIFMFLLFVDNILIGILYIFICCIDAEISVGTDVGADVPTTPPTRL